MYEKCRSSYPQSFREMEREKKKETNNIHNRNIPSPKQIHVRFHKLKVKNRDPPRCSSSSRAINDASDDVILLSVNHSKECNWRISTTFLSYVLILWRLINIYLVSTATWSFVAQHGRYLLVPNLVIACLIYIKYILCGVTHFGFIRSIPTID